MFLDEVQCRKACETLRKDIVKDCLFKRPFAYSQKEKGQEFEWERLPASGKISGRLFTRFGKPNYICVPVKLLYQFAAKREIPGFVVRDYFTQRHAALQPQRPSVWCFVVRVNEGVQRRERD